MTKGKGGLIWERVVGMWSVGESWGWWWRRGNRLGGVQFPPNVTRGLKEGKDGTRACIESKRQGGN